MLQLPVQAYHLATLPPLLLFRPPAPSPPPPLLPPPLRTDARRLLLSVRPRRTPSRGSWRRGKRPPSGTSGCCKRFVSPGRCRHRMAEEGEMVPSIAAQRGACESGGETRPAHRLLACPSHPRSPFFPPFAPLCFHAWIGPGAARERGIALAAGKAPGGRGQPRTSGAGESAEDFSKCI